MAETLPELIGDLAATEPGSAVTDLDLLSAQLGRLRFVHLRRRDVVAQAVSWARAVQTHYWHPGEDVEPGGQSPHYDEALIARLVEAIERFEAKWNLWFTTHGIEPWRDVYEDMAADPRRAAHDVLDYLGLRVPADQELQIRARRQADQVNTDGAARFRAR